MREKRIQFLYRLYDLADGDVRKWVDAFHIARELEFDEATIDTIIVYFRIKGFLQTEGFGRFSIMFASARPASITSRRRWENKAIGTVLGR